MASGSDGGAEGRARVVGTLVASLVAVALGWAYGSLIVGVGALVAGLLIATLWGRHAAQAALERGRPEPPVAGGGEDEPPPPVP